MQTKSDSVIDTQLDLQEAIELIEISRRLFQDKLSALKSKSEKAKDLKIKVNLEMQASDLYEDYKKSLAEIEKFIDEISKSITN